MKLAVNIFGIGGHIEEKLQFIVNTITFNIQGVRKVTVHLHKKIIRKAHSDFPNILYLAPNRTQNLLLFERIENYRT